MRPSFHKVSSYSPSVKLTVRDKTKNNSNFTPTTFLNNSFHFSLFAPHPQLILFRTLTSRRETNLSRKIVTVLCPSGLRILLSNGCRFFAHCLSAFSPTVAGPPFLLATHSLHFSSEPWNRALQFSDLSLRSSRLVCLQSGS